MKIFMIIISLILSFVIFLVISKSLKLIFKVLMFGFITILVYNFLSGVTV